MTEKQIQVTQIKVKPRYTAQSCPVCNSFGTLSYGTKKCHACKGKGYILIPTESESLNDSK